MKKTKVTKKPMNRYQKFTELVSEEVAKESPSISILRGFVECLGMVQGWVLYSPTRKVFEEFGGGETPHFENAMIHGSKPDPIDDFEPIAVDGLGFPVLP